MYSDIDLVPNGRSRRERMQRQVWWVLLPIFLFLVFGFLARGGRWGVRMLAFCGRKRRAESVQGVLERYLDLGPGAAEARVVVWA